MKLKFKFKLRKFVETTILRHRRHHKNLNVEFNSHVNFDFDENFPTRQTRTTDTTGLIRFNEKFLRFFLQTVQSWTLKDDFPTTLKQL